MKKYIVVLFSFISYSLFAQVTTEPDIPIDTKAVKIIYDATQGSGGLAGYTGDVYAHTGIITDESGSSSDWKNVKTGWGENTEDTKMTRIGDDLYELDITPTIREYYAAGDGVQILQMAFVFRDSEGNRTGKAENEADIFVDVFEEGLVVQFTNPTGDLVVDPGTNVSISISSTETADLSINVDDTELLTGSGMDYLGTSYTFTTGGDYWLWASATADAETVYDSIYVHVKSPTVEEAKPAAYKQGVNYLSDTEVALVLWAPEKDYVYAIGEFSDWKPSSAYQMKKDGDFYWIEIDGFTKGEQNIYQYLIDGNLKIADPYTEQTSDPWNDKWISDETYPNLVPYPEGKTEGIASVFTTGQEPYQWEVTDFQIPSTEKLVIYELLVRDFDSLHTYQAVIDRLDYLEDLNINVLELMPVNEFEGNSSWGYNPSFYFAADKYYGHRNDLKRLIDECHKRGIAVLLDIVLNHSFNQSPLAQMYWNSEMGRPAANNPWYNEEHNLVDNTAAHWGNDFNHESQATKDFIDSVNVYWLTEYNFDGFRFDFTKGFSNTIYRGESNWASAYDADRIAILKRMSDAIWEVKPDAIVSFEHLSENTEERELSDYGILLWGNMNHSYAEGAMGYNESGKSNLTGALHTSRGWDDPHLIAYQESHDEERVAYKCTQWGASDGDYNVKDLEVYTDRMEMTSTFLTLLPGPKMYWMFGELAYDYSIDENGRTGEKPIKWDYFDDPERNKLYRVNANLNYLKDNYDEFGNPEFTSRLQSYVKRFMAKDGENYVVAIANFDVKTRTDSIEFPMTGTWFDYFGQTTLDVTETKFGVTLGPGEYFVFSSREYDMPMEMPANDPLRKTITSIGNDPLQAFLVYPNPGYGQITVTLDEIRTIEIISTSGQVVKRIETASSNGELTLDVSDLERGMYIINVTDKNNRSHQNKFLKQAN